MYEGPVQDYFHLVFRFTFLLSWIGLSLKKTMRDNLQPSNKMTMHQTGFFAFVLELELLLQSIFCSYDKSLIEKIWR